MDALGELGIPGAVVGVLDRGKASIVCAGVTDVDDPRPVDERTVFQIGSISKTFVATAASILVDQGRLDLDEPIRSYLPSTFRLSSEELTDGVTTRHLLTHVTGWPGDYFADTGEGDDALKRLVAKLAKAPQLQPLGATYSYSNSAVNLASYVVATVNGTSYEKAVRDLVLRPLGMRSTFFSAEAAITRRVAIGHRDGRPQPWRRPRAHHGSGGVLTTAADLLRYADFHLHDPTMAGLQDVQRPAGSHGDEVGLIWMIDHLGGEKIVHHGGTTNGYQADLRLVPGRDLAWVMLTNAEHHHQFDRVLLRHFLGVDECSLIDPSATPADQSGYCGLYRAVLAEINVEIGDDGQLRASVATPATAVWSRGEAPPPPHVTRLGFRGDVADAVVALDRPYAGDRGEFLRGDTGEIEWFRWDGRIARRLT